MCFPITEIVHIATQVVHEVSELYEIVFEHISLSRGAILSTFCTYVNYKNNSSTTV